MLLENLTKLISFFRTSQCTKCSDESNERSPHSVKTSGGSYELVPESSCEPSFVQKRLVALHPSGQKLFSEVFWIPSACSCQKSELA